MIAFLYELLTGKPYLTGRQASADFGPPPGAVYQAELSQYSDLALIYRDRDEILAEVRAQRAAARKSAWR